MRHITTAMALTVALAAHAHAQVRPLDPGDERLKVLRPFAEEVVRHGPDSAGALASRFQKDPSKRAELTSMLSELLTEYGGSKYRVGMFRPGPGSNVVVELTRPADGWIAAFAVEVNATNQVEAVGPVRFRGATVRPPRQAGGSASAGAERRAVGSPPAAARTTLERRLAERFAAAADSGFSGVALVTRGSDTLLAAAHGMADRERRIPNALDTRFNLGSGDKLFTKIGIAQLISAGKVALTDTVGRFLPDYPNETVRRKVTVEHLIRHRSGLGSHLREAIERRHDRIRTLAGLVPMFSHEEPAFEPGTQSRYSNSGYVLLGRIIEVASGVSYYDYVRTNIFEPAGMRSTAYLTLDEWPRDRAIGYTAIGNAGAAVAVGTPRDTTLQPNTDRLTYVGSSAGAGYSTARDILRLDRALREGRLMEPRFDEIMFMRSPDGRVTIPANGGTWGVNFELRRVGEYTIIVMANRDPRVAEELSAGLAALLPQTGGAR